MRARGSSLTSGLPARRCLCWHLLLLEVVASSREAARSVGGPPRRPPACLPPLSPTLVYQGATRRVLLLLAKHLSPRPLAEVRRFVSCVPWGAVGVSDAAIKAEPQLRRLIIPATSAQRTHALTRAHVARKRQEKQEPQQPHAYRFPQ